MFTTNFCASAERSNKKTAFSGRNVRPRSAISNSLFALKSESNPSPNPHAKPGFDPVGRGHVNGALRAELGFDPFYYCPCERGLI